jgi:HlyD family secretion protein
MSLSPRTQKSLTLVAVAAALVLAGGYAWKQWQASHADAGLASGNGRIEATEIDVATKLGGRVEEILVTEGAFVKAGELLARMQIHTLQAQRAEAVAGKDRPCTPWPPPRPRWRCAKATTPPHWPWWPARSRAGRGRRRLARSETLAKEGASAVQELDDDRPACAAPKPRSRPPGPGRRRQGRHRGGPAEVTGADSAVKAAAATVQRIEAELDDSELTAPRDAACSTAWPSPARCWAPAARC